ncbi:VacJ family lipoprotein [Lysobacter ciconiae]|uniref:VacJ family lipoprotein n=1 Tax=Novilysobacter ciconiae TaxID=2781022 RepID=A0A7S6UFY1_9GAMM|nr:MlaA family lipoprotein [Lysobacter ciconiae]QOW19558.1 VacJ family lipoprotein [Lysobacter ciconiae]
MPTSFRNRHRRAPSLVLGLGLVLAVTGVGCASAPPVLGAAATPVVPATPATDAGSELPAVIEPAATEPAAIGAQDAPAGDTPAESIDAPPAVSATDQDAAGMQARTAAERDFDALYGVYDPVADPTLPAAAQIAGVYDPWERYNRPMHRFNNAVDRTIARPLAQFYVAVAPRPVRLGVSNFFSNLGQPVTALNALLQGKPAQAGQALGRFVLNTTLGIAGIFDPASDAKLDRRNEDFGQTLGVWGWERSRYVELPLFGPRTVRDVLGMVGDAPLSPLRQVEQDKIRIPLQGLQLVDVRTQLLATDSLREGASDDYALVRDAWMQRRNYQILGDRMGEDTDNALPDYLRDDDNPLVPASAMPVMPTDN